jgi:hypothetical protein
MLPEVLHPSDDNHVIEATRRSNARVADKEDRAMAMLFEPVHANDG